MGLRDLFTRTPGEIIPDPLPDLGSPRGALTAAGARVDLTDTRGGALTAKIPAWQADAWVYAGAIGEVGTGHRRTANIMSRLLLYIGVVPDRRLAPVDVDDATTSPEGSDEPPLVTDLDPQLIADAKQALADLAGGSLGHANIMRALSKNLDVAGDCYLIGRTDPLNPAAAMQWEVRATGELQRNQQGHWILVGSPSSNGQIGARGVELAPDDYVAKIYTPDDQWHDLSTSPMKGVLDPCEQLFLKNKKMRIRDRARLARGILLISQNLIYRNQKGEPSSFEQALTANIVAAVQDENSQAALARIIVTAPAEEIKDGTAMQTIDLIDKDDDTRDAEEAERQLTRVLNGLDFPEEFVRGSRDAKFANLVGIDSTTFRYFIEPKATAACDGLVVVFLWPILEALGHPRDQVRRLVIWYDPTEVVTNPNRMADVKTAHDALAASDKALRDAAALTDADAPEALEMLRRLAMRGRTVPDNIQQAVAAQLAEEAGIDLPALEDTGAAGGQPPDSTDAESGGSVDGQGQQGEGPITSSAALTTRQAAPWSARALALDLTLRDQLLGLADGAMNRALDRAGARLVSKARNNLKNHALQGEIEQRLAGVLLRDAWAELRPSDHAALGLDEDTLLTGAFDSLRDQFVTLTTETFEQGLQAACTLLGLTYYPPGLTAATDTPLSGEAPDTAGLGGLDQIAMRTRAATDIAQAADGLAADLYAQARARMLDPGFTDSPNGETGALTVSTGTVRKALATAGGAGSSPYFSGLDENGRTLSDTDPDPGYVATGLNIRGALTVAGVAQYAQEWHWGGSTRPFLPHQELDGLVFNDRTDTRLTTTAKLSWLPGTTLFPGDHRGCSCSLEPLVESPYAGLDPADVRRIQAAQKARRADGTFVGPVE